MCPASVAENMIEAMISVPNEERAAGDYASAIERLTMFIGSIEDNDAEVRSKFGTSLAPSEGFASVHPASLPGAIK